MTTLLALLPLLLVLGLLASGRASALVAGLAGLSATLAVSAVLVTARQGGEVLGSLFLRETSSGLWLSWHVIAIIAAGMFFYRCQQARGTSANGATLPANPRRLWAVCFLLAPFAEAVTGFGVGYIIALAALRRLGLGGLPALLLGLYSQSLVPWGALATGTTVGATLAGLTPNQLGLSSALLQMPIHALYLVFYWRLAREAGLAASLAQKIDDALWTALLLGLVWLFNFYSDVEIAGAAPTALLLALRFWRDERPDRARLVAALQANAPYVALTLALCATRLVPPVRDFLRPLWAMRPFDNQPAFAPLYAPGFWLVSIGVIVVVLARASLGRVLAETARGAWRSCAVTLLFVVMAEFYVGSGMAQEIAEALRAAAGRDAALARAAVRRRRRFPHRRRLGGQRHADAHGDRAGAGDRRRPGLDRGGAEQRLHQPHHALADPRLDGGRHPLARDVRCGALPPRLAAGAAAAADRFCRHRGAAGIGLIWLYDRARKIFRGRERWPRWHFWVWA